MTLAELASRVHPDNASHQAKWIAAVEQLRAGRGWVADGKVGFKMQDQTPEAAPKFAGKVQPILRRIKL